MSVRSVIFRNTASNASCFVTESVWFRSWFLEFGLEVVRREC
jgi:hypothetical protein